MLLPDRDRSIYQFINGLGRDLGSLPDDWQVTVLCAVEETAQVQLCRGFSPHPERQSLSPRDGDGIGARLVANLQPSVDFE